VQLKFRNNVEISRILAQTMKTNINIESCKSVVYLILNFQLKGRNSGARRNCPLLSMADKHVSAATDTHTKIQNLFQLFSMWSALRLYNGDQRDVCCIRYVAYPNYINIKHM
jgi:hypothetical protein